MEDYKIENYIEIDGTDIPIKELPEEEHRKISEKIQDTMMFSMGFVRKVG